MYGIKIQWQAARGRVLTPSKLAAYVNLNNQIYNEKQTKESKASKPIIKNIDKCHRSNKEKETYLLWTYHEETRQPGERYYKLRGRRVQPTRYASVTLTDTGDLRTIEEEEGGEGEEANDRVPLRKQLTVSET